jgi:integrase
MALNMANVQKRGDTYEVRVQIPADVRHAFGGKWAVVRSLRTSDGNEALERAAPIIADTKRRIAAARKGQKLAPKPAPTPAGVINPDEARAAMQRWLKVSTDQAYLDHFNGTAARMSPFGAEASALSRTVHALRERRFADVPDFDDKLVAALSGQGVEMARGHPALPRLRGWFAEAWDALERRIERFRREDFTEWSLEAVPEPQHSLVASVPPIAAPASTSGYKPLSDVLESYLAREQPAAKEASEIRGYVRRLIEHLGDVPVRDVTTMAMDAFLVKLRKYPVTKRPDIAKLKFDDIIAAVGDDATIPKLSNKTIRVKWFGAYNRLFKYAVSRRLIDENPVAASMPKKADDARTPTKEREAWTPSDIKAMFAKPLFTGCSSLAGNRDEPGDRIAKDHKFWLPLVALWSGMRLDEIGATARDELKCENGVWFIDLRKRPLSGPRRVKNKMSQRIVPIHKRLIDLGFVEYAKAQTEWLFPDLPHDGTEPGDTTALFSKWFGRWRRANGLHDGKRKVDFHSFRYTFKDAGRRAYLPEDLNDLLTGHAGTDNQKTSRGYKGAGDPVFLLEVVNKIGFSTFPL